MSEPRVPHLLDEDADAGDASSMLRSALRGARADVPDAARMETLSRSIAGAIGGGGGDGGGDTGGDGGGGGGAAVGGAGAIGVTKLALGGAAVVAAIGVALFAASGPAPTVDANANANTDVSANANANASASASAAASANAETVVDVHALPAARVPPVVDAARAAAAGSERATAPAEMTLLREAQDALGSAPAEALARCEEHAKTYPAGALAEEREVIAVDALIRLGRRSEAQARATRFRAAHPGSAYLRRLDTLLGAAP